MRRFPPVPRRASSFLCVLAGLFALWAAGTNEVAAQQRTYVDPNVNMVRGIALPDGDPYLQRQNEPSIAVSTRNPCHLVAGANDYRSVDIPFDNTLPPPNGEPNVSLAGDAWLGLFKSFDCGQKWQSTMLPGFPQDNSGKALTLKGYEAGADPTVRAGTNGLFYYSGMVFNRGTQGDSKIFVARLVDNNNKERGDPIEFLDVTTVDTGSKGQFLDKPWMAVDVPRNSFGPGSTLAGGTSASGTCSVNGQQVPAGNVYMAWAKFTGNSGQHSKLMFARSTDCGKTFNQHPVSNNQTLSQGANIAIAPHDGTIYLTWREFAGNNKPVSMWVAVSSDGGKTFTNPKKIGDNLKTFDQVKTTTKFRSNALPAITADHEGRVYIAWSERGFAPTCIAPDKSVKATDDARIVMMVSNNRGQTFAPRFPIDPSPKCGHQMMPSFAFAAGKITGIYYDAREDASGKFTDYIDDKDILKGQVRHTIDVRAVQATPAPQPVFVTAGSESLEVSKYRTWTYTVPVVLPDGTTKLENRSSEIGSNPPNLPMYAAGSMPFMGDYIDLSGLSAFPIPNGSGQVWQPNIGNLTGATGLMSSAFPTLPIFHAAWTDNRDVRSVAGMCAVPPNPSATGERNANIYTARLTTGLFVGSPGNTKPLGTRTVVDKEGKPVAGPNGQPLKELIQRGFVVFAQNTTDALRFYKFQITNQPAGGKASFRQFEKPGQTRLDRTIVSIPKGSTVARTVYATSEDQFAQILVNIFEVTPPPAAGDPKNTDEWLPAVNGLSGSVLLNPDRTNPEILQPDLDELDPTVPQIATTEVHNPSMFDAEYFKHPKGTGSRQLDVMNPRIPDPENPDPENPDPENPDPENPDPENPDPENPDPENPDPENPDPENPDPENPDPENLSVRNESVSDDLVNNGTITDINWKVHNAGNTTSAYKFRPSIATHVDGQQYQLIVTRRYMSMAMAAVQDPITGVFTCKPVFKSQNQVITSIENFRPRMPDPENPDPENPDPENPDPENPDPENPDPENPDPENANFFLSPDETATVTLRVFTPSDEAPPTSEVKVVAAKTSAQAANTGQTTVSTAVVGPDLVLNDPAPTVAPAFVRPGKTASVSWTLTNRGTGPANHAVQIQNKVYLSTDAILSTGGGGDDLIATVPAAMPLPECEDEGAPAACRRTFLTSVTMPSIAGEYFVIIVADTNDDVFEADELNNKVVVPVVVANYQLSFTTQPTSATQDFTITPAVVVNVTHPDNGAVTAADVPGVTLSIANNPSAGTLTGTLFKPTGTTSFGDLTINNAGDGYTLSASAPMATGATSAAFNIEADLPPVVAPDTYTTNEEQALQPAAPGVLGNDSDPATKGTKPASYTFHAEKITDPSNGTLTVNTDGSFSYAPAANFAGSDSFTYRAKDGRPGNQTTGTANITVNAVNDVPSFIKGADQIALEDSVPQSIPGWATAISAGPANEASQTVDFIVTNSNTALFSSQPAVSSTGTLTYTSGANASGVATVTVRIHDSGGIANGGVDTSAAQTFTITITADNDAPVATADSYTTREDTSVGRDAVDDPDALLDNDTDAENDVLVAEYLTTTTNGVLSPHANGSFSYAPNANFFGTDSFTYRAFDGTTTGNTVTVTFTVQSVNDAPSFTAGANQSVPENSGAQTMANWATAISKGPANESAQTLTFIVSNDNGQLFSVAPAISATGTLTFTPRANRQGVANVTVQLQDNGGTANGGVDTSAARTFTISVTNAATTFVVTNTNDSGAGSLRQAIINANANASADTITFNIPGAGVRTITPLTALPAIVFAANIDATTQPGFSGSPLIELNGSVAGAGVAGLSAAAAGITVRAVAITQFQGAGIEVTGATAGARLTQNAISDNGGLGIDILPAGVNPNDALDADLGPNSAQNFPIVSRASVNGTSTLITGTITSAPNTAYTIELFTNVAADPSGYGEGHVYRQSVAVNTDGSGDGSFSVTVPVAFTLGSFVTATATDPSGNTSEFSQARVVVANNPPTATNDQILTVSDMAMTTAPASNDVDPDVAGPEVRTTYRPVSGAFGPLLGPGGVAVVTSTNRGYFTGGNSAATPGKIGVLDLSTNAVVAAIPLPGNFGAAFTEVDQTEQVVFFRGGINLLALDARPTSATFHQLLLNINLGTINSWALDAVRHRLYVTTQTTGNGLIASGRFTVFDTDRTSGNFLQVLAEGSVPGLNGTATAIGVNTVTNKIYVAVTGGTPGLYAVNPATLAMTQIFSTSGLNNITSVAVNNVDNMIYAVGGSALHSVDGSTNTKTGQITLTASASAGSFDTRLLIHRGTGRVYVRLGSFPNASNLVVVDGKRGSPTINSVVATIPLGRENGSAFMALDESIDRLIATSATDLRSHIIDTNTNSVVGTPLMATQPLGRVSLDPTTHRVYLTGGPGYVKVADLSTAALVTDVHVATSIWGLAVDPLTHSLYVSESGLTTAIKRINEAGVSGSIPLTHGDGSEVYMARNSATNKIYALNNGATVAGGSDGLPGFVHVVNGSTYAVTDVAAGNKPFGIAIDEVNNKIYVGNQSQGQSFPGGISIIDGVTNAVVQANVSAIPSINTPHLISVGRDMVVTSSGRLYFRVTGGAATQMLGTMTGTVAAPVSLGNVNVNIIRYNRVTDRLYVGASSAGGPNQIFVIDPATNAIVTTLTVGSPTTFVTTQSYIAMNTATNRLFISDFEEMQLHVLDATTHAVLASIPMPLGPSTVAVDEVHNRIYVGDPIKRSLTIVDGATLRVARTLALPIAPVGLHVDSSLSPARIFAYAVEPEGAISVIDDPGTAAPQITSVTQGTNGGTVVLNADGSVTYTSAAGYVGADSYTYTTTDGQGATTTGTANVTVYGEMSIQPATLANGTIGQNYSQTLSRTGGSGSPVVWTVSGFLPGGVQLSSTGVITGTLRQSGNFTFTINARDTGQDLLSESQTYTVIVGPPAIAPAFPTNPTINLTYSQQLFVGGASGTVTWSLNTGGHPALSWLSLSNSGVLSGMPTQYGSMPPFTVTATYSTGPTASRTYSLNVGGPLTMLDLREGIVLETQPSITFLGGNGTKGLTLTSGSLPPGITLSTGGVFTGTPMRHGTYNFTLQLNDCLNGSCSNPQTATKAIAWRVSARDQQNFSSNGPTLIMGGTPNRKVAQVFTVGAMGSLNAVGLSGLTCQVTQTTVTVDVQRLTSDGLPDGTSIATGSAQSNFGAIAISPPVPVAIGERLALIASVGGPLTCSSTNTATFDSYNAGDAYVATTGPWSKLTDADVDNNGTVDGVYDLPSFRTLITPAMPVSYSTMRRSGHTATALNNGKVLVFSGSSTAVGELYDPATNTMTVTAGAASVVRENATATRLGNGTVLIVGGRDQNGVRHASAAIFNPVTETFSATNGPMAFARENHRAVRFEHLGAEKVLITGGLASDGSALSSAEIYDVSSKTFSSAGTMTTARESHTATLLQSGKVLIVGGFSNANPAELYDPLTATFMATAGQPAVAFRGQAAAALLGDGRVLIAGGSAGGVFPDVLADAVLYDPLSNSFTTTGSMTSRRYAHSATLLPDGSVLIAGGFAEQSVSSYVLPLATMERFVPGANGFVAAGSMETRRQTHTATALADGKVFVMGGSSQSWMSGNTGEIYDPAGALTLSPSTVGDSAPGVAISPVVFSVTGGTAPYEIAFAGGGLPPGLTYDQSQATLSGTPTTAGLYTFSLRASDGASHLNVQSFTMRVGSVNTITTGYRLPNAAQGVPYSTQLAASGQQPITWAVLPASSQLPQGLNLTSTGLITGTPTTAGFFNFAVRALDAQGVQAFKTHAIQVNGALTITTATVPEGAVFDPYSFCLGSSNATGTQTWSVANGLPGGVTMQSNGCFTGAPTGLGPFSFTAQVTDSGSPVQVASRNFSMRVWAREQQGTSSGGTAITFGGPSGRKFAQTVVAGANGSLTAFGLTSISCQPTGVVTVEIQGVSADGRPDGVTVASGSTANGYSGIALSSPVSMTIDRRFAAVITSTTACDVFASTSEFYQPGDGYSGTGNNWTLLKNTDGRYDIPFRTLIQPAVDLTYLRAFRSSHAAALLNNNKVLLISSGGTTEQVDPSTKTSTTTASLTASRSGFTTTLLDDGTVLVTGGSSFNPLTSTSTYYANAELYLATGTFTPTGSMLAARQGHAATRLGDGRVLVTGGFNSSAGTLTSAEIYDPVTDTFTPTGNMTVCRSDHRGTLLNDGKVLVAGGFGCGVVNSAELYDPIAGTFTAIAGGTIAPRRGHTATLLQDGRVLLAGGNHTSFPDVLNTAELYNPATNTFTATGNLTIARSSHAAALMADGSVVLSGGRDNQSAARPLSTMERFNPVSGTFAGAGSMEVGRSFHTATMLANNQVLIAGGGGGQSWLTGNSAEVYDPALTPSLTTVLPDGQVNVAYPSTTLAAAGGSGAGYQITVAAATLPPGLSFNSSTLLLSGTPTTAGVYSVVFTVVDSLNHSVTQPVIVRVSSLSITTATLPSATLNSPYSSQLAATGVGGITWSLWSGALPLGLNLSSAGTITGTPTTTGFTSFTVRAVDSAGQFAVKSLSLNVLGPLTINTTSLSDGTAGNTYFACFSTSNGVGPFTWSLSGQVPVGMAFPLTPSSCLDSSYPARVIRQAGTFNFTVTVTDSSSTPQVASRNYTIRMHGQDQQVGSAYPDPGAIALPPTRRVAQVLTAATPYNLTGVQLSNIASCVANTQITATVWPVTGVPARPDENGSALGMATATASSSGFFNSMLTFPSPIAMPQHARFAIVISFVGGPCSGVNWPTNDWYTHGSGWINDGAAWQPASSVIGRPDVPLTTLVMPDNGLAFLATGRSGHASAPTSGGRILMVGSEATAEVYDPVANTLTSTGSMSVGRWGATATPLAGGKVLIVGGQYWDNTNQITVYPTSTEIFDPNANGGIGGFSPGPVLSTGRQNHRATRLANGRVLISGGNNWDGSTWQTLQSALLFDSNGSLITTLNMTGSRSGHSATLLADGNRVLILGGWTGSSPPPTQAEIYDPAAVEPFTSAGNPLNWHGDHTATLLTTAPLAGQVLIAGGTGVYPDLATTSELFDPTSSTFSAAPGLRVPRLQATATALPDGRIAYVGGSTNWTSWTPTSVVEVYDPVSNAFSLVGDLLVDRAQQTVDVITGGPNAGKLAVAGGYSSSALAYRTLELFDAAGTALAITTPSLPDGVSNVAYAGATIEAAGGTGPYAFTLVWGQLPAGLSFVNGTIAGTPSTGGPYSFVVRVTDSASASAYKSFTVYVDRLTITSTNPLPNGFEGGFYNFQLAATGAGQITWTLEPGYTLPGNITLSSSGLLSGATPTATFGSFNVRATDASGQWQLKFFNLQIVTSTGYFQPMGAMNVPRSSHIAQQLNNGLVLLAGSDNFLTSAELYNPANGTSSATGSLSTGRCYGCSAIKLADGNILAAGGWNGGTVLSTAEVYNAATGTWSATLGNMSVNRLGGNPVRLLSNKILILGGHPGSSAHVSADLYDPASKTFTATGNMAVARTGAASVRLVDGRVLVAGGQTDSGARTATAEIYDPLLGTFSNTGSMATAKQPSGGVLLPDGRVLIAGGWGGVSLQTAEVFDPSTGLFSAVGSMGIARSGHATVLLNNGLVLVAGGTDASGNILSSAELFNPVTNTFMAAPSLAAPRSNASVVMLSDGRVLLTGGTGIFGRLNTVEIYTP